MIICLSFVILFITATESKQTCNRNASLNCTGWEHLSLEPLGLMRLQTTNTLCRYIDTLTVCLNDAMGGCPDSNKASWLPVLDSANFICHHISEYKKAVKCYFRDGVALHIKGCLHQMSNIINVNCDHFTKLETCVHTSVENCSKSDVDLISGIMYAFTKSHKRMLNCPLKDLETTTTQNPVTSTKSVQVVTSILVHEIVFDAEEANPSVGESRNRSSSTALHASLGLVISAVCSVLRHKLI